MSVRRLLIHASLGLGLLLHLISCNSTQRAPGPVPVKAASQPVVSTPRAFLIHIPGVSGESTVDHTLTAGLRQGGFDGDIEIFEWTEHDPGIPALQAIDRNKKQAKKIAEELVRRYRADPRTKLYLTCHSGGAGLAAWTLEDLPADVKVEEVLFLAPALSPGYDLSRALSHVRHKADVFYSDHDAVVLSAGTRLFGTIDGVYSDAAGYVGFTPPRTACQAEYAKLVQFKYDPKWYPLGNDGEHIGPMSTRFAKTILAPLLKESN